MSDPQLTCPLRVGDEVEALCECHKGLRCIVTRICAGVGVYVTGSSQIFRLREDLKLIRRVESIEAETPRFKVGDRVRVREGAVYGQDFGFHRATPDMPEFEVRSISINDRAKLQAPGYGGDPYGNGSIYANLRDLIPPSPQPCPNCVGAPWDVGLSKTFAMTCPQCCLCGPKASTKDAAIEAWNRIRMGGEA
jgi:hypothetical protein